MLNWLKQGIFRTMDPKMTAKDAATTLNVPVSQLERILRTRNLPFAKQFRQVYFGHITACGLFQCDFDSQVVAFQIVKGGTGKTSLAHEFAVRAHLYGAKVLCIDLDQQGNLTQSFKVDAEKYPVMVDILAENYPVHQSIIPVCEGIDLISSRIENSILDETIRLTKKSLNTIYADIFHELKKQYDLIVVDCPPNLGQSVTAVALSADRILSPVTPEKFALCGLASTYKAIKELEVAYECDIQYDILLNKYDPKSLLSKEALDMLVGHTIYQKHLLSCYISQSIDFPNAIAQGGSIFDSVKTSQAKVDLDQLTKVLLGLEQKLKHKVPAKKRVRIFADIFGA